MLNQKFYPAFGYIIAKNTTEPGVEYTTSITNESASILFYVDGYLEFSQNNKIVYTTKADTMERANEHPIGTYHTRAGPEGCVFFCLDTKPNRGIIPDHEWHVLDANMKIEFDSNTKLYLCNGQMKIDDDIINGPKQIFVRTDKKIIETLTKCHCLLFL